MRDSCLFLVAIPTEGGLVVVVTEVWYAYTTTTPVVVPTATIPGTIFNTQASPSFDVFHLLPDGTVYMIIDSAAEFVVSWTGKRQDKDKCGSSYTTN